MNAWFAEWYNENECRAYPLDDVATAIDDSGNAMPSDIIVDAFVRWPISLGTRAFVSTVTVSAKLITATILCYDENNEGAFIPLASVAAPRSKQGVPIKLTAYQSGAAGWIVFGRCNILEGNYVFSTPCQSALLPRVARPFKATAVSGVTVSGSSTVLTGDVALQGYGDLSVTVEQVKVRREEDTVVNAIVLQLAGQDLTSALLRYRGPCGNRPESNTCRRTAIKTINGISTNDDGEFDLRFAWPVQPHCIDSAIILDCDVGMQDICSTAPVTLPSP